MKIIQQILNLSMIWQQQKIERERDQLLNKSRHHYCWIKMKNWNTKNTCLVISFIKLYYVFFSKTGCLFGFYGKLCDKECPKHCDGPCDLDNGICSFGCQDGFIGYHCNEGSFVIWWLIL